MKLAFLAAVCTAAVAIAAPAAAVPILTQLNTDLVTAPATFSFQGASFTFGSATDPFAPLTVQTGGNGAVSAFGGFLGIPLSPSSSFTDRSIVTYGPAFGQYAPFTSTTSVGASNGLNFLGLRATVGTDNYYGFAFTENAVLRGYGFETMANTAITATTALSAAVPEPATWGLMIVGFALVGGGLRARRSSTRVTYA